MKRRWYIWIGGPNWWRFIWHSEERYGIFRNREGVKPGRWGFFVLGFEVGSRDPGDPVGLWLRRWGLWPW